MGQAIRLPRAGAAQRDEASFAQPRTGQANRLPHRELMWTDMVTDLRFAARMLAKTPTLTAGAVALLAVGIGGGTLLFSAFESVWLRPLPVRHPEQLVRMVQHDPRLGPRSYFLYPYYRVLVEHSTTLSAAFGETEVTAAMSEPAPAEQVRVRMVTPEFFTELGARPIQGRVLAADDVERVVLSYGFWQRRFHGEAVVGREIVLHGHKFTIAGVMAREFNGVSSDNTPEVRATLRALPLLGREGEGSVLEDQQLDLAGRMKPGVTLEQAQAECLALWRPAIQAWYARTPEFGVEAARRELERGMQLDSLERGLSIVRDKFGDALRLLAAASGLLLLMVCANVAGLMLAGSAARRPEIAVRLALGATRGRLARQMLCESLLLVALGAAGGWLLTWAGGPLLIRALPPVRDLATTPLAISLDPNPDWRVMLAALGATLLTAVLVGLAPTASASRMNLDAVLRGVRGSHAWGGRNALVIVQVAMCTVLLAGAGLLVRTFTGLRAVSTGFDAEHVVTFTTETRLNAYTRPQSKAFWLALRTRVGELPGVAGAAAASRALMRGSGVKTTVTLPGEKASPADFLNSSLNSVTFDYFDVLGIRMVRGRGFTPADTVAVTPAPAIVNQAFVRRFFPNTDPIGQRFGNSVTNQRVIVGVASDAKYRSLREPMTPTFYDAADSDFSVLCVRTRSAPEGVIGPVRKALAALDPALPITEIHTLAEEVEASAEPERLTAVLAGLFSGFATLLAAAGIYGLLAFAVEQRRREIGIRMALGAQPGQIGSMLGRQAASLLAQGIAVGLAAALVLTGSLRTILYGVKPVDPVSLVLAVLVLCVVAAAATLIPARRAARVEPATALRQD